MTAPAGRFFPLHETDLEDPFFQVVGVLGEVMERVGVVGFVVTSESCFTLTTFETLCVVLYP